MIRHFKLINNIRYLATSVSALKGTSFSLFCLGITVNPITIGHETSGWGSGWGSGCGLPHGSSGSFLTST